MKYKFLEKENWFKHDFRSREDKKLIRLKMKWKSAAPIGVFWQLCEMLYENAGILDYDLDVIAFNCGDTVELVEDVIKMCFIITDDNKLTHETIIEQLDDREQNYNAMVEKKSKAGKASAEAKRLAKELEQNSNNSSTDVEQVFNTSQQNSTREESREIREESREIRDKNKLLAVYNKPEVDVFISDDNNEIDYFQDDSEVVISFAMLDRVIDKFVSVDNKFKFNSVMTEINEDFGGIDNLLEMYLPNDTSAQSNYRNLFNQYKNGIYAK